MIHTRVFVSVIETNTKWTIFTIPAANFDVELAVIFGRIFFEEIRDNFELLIRRYAPFFTPQQSYEDIERCGMGVEPFGQRNQTN